MPTSAAFYSVSDARYFLGVVGMLNSLRLLGHQEPVYVLDCGLTPEQRELLSPHATLVPAPSDSPPWLLKTVAPISHPAEVMVLIDADMIVTRSLAGLVEQASRGKVVAFEHRDDRFVPEWGQLMGLGRAARRQYVCTGLMVLSGPLGSEILNLMADMPDRVDFDRTAWRANDPDYAFQFGDQDVLNAILASRVDPGQVVEVDARLEAVPPFTGLRVEDEEALRCVYDDGTEPNVVHHPFPTKPWLQPTTPGVYTQLLVRLLRGSDVAVRVPRRDLPPHLQPGLRGFVSRKRVNTGDLRWRVAGPLVARVRALRERLARGGR